MFLASTIYIARVNYTDESNTAQVVRRSYATSHPDDTQENVVKQLWLDFEADYPMWGIMSVVITGKEYVYKEWR